MTEPTRDQTVATSALELVVVIAIGVAFVAAIVAALTYDFVSARAPLFILFPLVILIGVQFRKIRTFLQANIGSSTFAVALKENRQKLGRSLQLVTWTGVLMVLMYVAGHYVASAAFMYLLLHNVSSESKKLSVTVSLIVTIILFVLFEHGFSIELSRGVIFEFLSERFGD